MCSLRAGSVSEPEAFIAASGTGHSWDRYPPDLLSRAQPASLKIRSLLIGFGPWSRRDLQDQEYENSLGGHHALTKRINPSACAPAKGNAGFPRCGPAE